VDLSLLQHSVRFLSPLIQIYRGGPNPKQLFCLVFRKAFLLEKLKLFHFSAPLLVRSGTHSVAAKCPDPNPLAGIRTKNPTIRSSVVLIPSLHGHRK